jgi:hypothetical protein
MKRKQLSFTEVELGILLDALRNQWWARYNPKVETTVEIHHNLLDRIITAQVQLENQAQTDS